MRNEESGDSQKARDRAPLYQVRGEDSPKRRYAKGQGRILKDGRHVCKAKVGGTGPRRNRPCMRKARAHGYCHKHAKTHVYGRGGVAQAGDHEPARDYSTADS